MKKSTIKTFKRFIKEEKEKCPICNNNIDLGVIENYYNEEAS